ncbi:MAG TPA: hypothetical protein VF588_04930 [Pyrinomonadaceae bacterium]|jgi:hypothetical protein
MASTYFLNANAQSGQTAQISLTLNSGSTITLGGLNDPNKDPFCNFKIGPSPAKDVLGLGGVNTLAVRTNNGNSNWTIKLDRNFITASADIQFLVFVNRVVGRQNRNTQGFTITQTPSPMTAKPAGTKRRKRVP